MDGFLLIDKPSGPTSHDVVDAVRRMSGVRRVGHAGTLDPFASGLLILGIGATTKKLSRLVGLDKEYEALFVLGAVSETDDPEGPIRETGKQAAALSEERIREAMQTFVGDIEQVPPAYAAIKIRGKKMYEAAREGKPLEAPPRRVSVFMFTLIEPIRPMGPLAHLRVCIHCSSGTYVRALARDLGKTLGVGGYVAELRRTKIGPFRVEDAVALSRLARHTAGLAKPLPLCEDVDVTLDRYEKISADPSSL